MTPEALRRRMAHGNIYPAEQVDAALGNYFRVGNLGALRELALLWVADRVDEALQRLPRRATASTSPWETRERVVVAVTGAPERRAPDPPGGPHGAARATGELHRRARAVRRRARRRAPAAARRAPRSCSTSSAARYHEVVGDDVAEALVAVRPGRERHAARARRQPAQSRWAELAQRLGHQRGDPRRRAAIDVHVIADRAPTGRRRRTPLAARPAAPAAALAGAVRSPAGCSPSIGAPAAHRRCSRQSATRSTCRPTCCCYLLLVVGRRGRRRRRGRPSSPRSSASLLVNWYFTPPLHTFTIADGRERPRARRRSSSSPAS